MLIRDSTEVPLQLMIASKVHRKTEIMCSSYMYWDLFLFCGYGCFQLLDVLEGKIALEQGLVPLTTPQVWDFLLNCQYPWSEFCQTHPCSIFSVETTYDFWVKVCTPLTLLCSVLSQKKLLAPEIAANAREIELLRIEVTLRGSSMHTETGLLRKEGKKNGILDLFFSSWFVILSLY